MALDQPICHEPSLVRLVLKDMVLGLRPTGEQLRQDIKIPTSSLWLVISQNLLNLCFNLSFYCSLWISFDAVSFIMSAFICRHVAVSQTGRTLRHGIRIFVLSRIFWRPAGSLLCLLFSFFTVWGAETAITTKCSHDNIYYTVACSPQKLWHGNRVN